MTMKAMRSTAMLSGATKVTAMKPNWPMYCRTDDTMLIRIELTNRMRMLHQNRPRMRCQTRRNAVPMETPSSTIAARAIPWKSVTRNPAGTNKTNSRSTDRSTVKMSSSLMGKLKRTGNAATSINRVNTVELAKYSNSSEPSRRRTCRHATEMPMRSPNTARATPGAMTELDITSARSTANNDTMIIVTLVQVIPDSEGMLLSRPNCGSVKTIHKVTSTRIVEANVNSSGAPRTTARL